MAEPSLPVTDQDPLFRLERCQQRLGYRFGNLQLLEAALTHASGADHRLSSNERLEFLGDAILGLVVCEQLFQQFPDQLEGDLTKLKSIVVSRQTCAKISQALGLREFLVLGKGMTTHPAVPPSVLSDVLESLIAAIYLDGGLEPARKFILDNMNEIILETAESTHQQNFKSVLQQYAQKHLPTNPIYVLMDEKGPDHAKCFEVCVEIQGRRFSSAWANSKKEAEQKAALLALSDLGLAQVEGDGRVVLLEPLIKEVSVGNGE